MAVPQFVAQKINQFKANQLASQRAHEIRIATINKGFPPPEPPNRTPGPNFLRSRGIPSGGGGGGVGIADPSSFGAPAAAPQGGDFSRAFGPDNPPPGQKKLFQNTPPQSAQSGNLSNFLFSR